MTVFYWRQEMSDLAMKVLKCNRLAMLAPVAQLLPQSHVDWKRISMVITSALPMTQPISDDALHLLSRSQKSEIHSTRLQSSFRHSKASSTNGIPSLLCWSLKWRYTETKHQRLTVELASYARTNHKITRLTLDEACSLLKISRPIIAASMRFFYCLICRFDSLFGDSTHATRTTTWFTGWFEIHHGRYWLR